MDKKNRLTSLFGGAVGNLVEWYDWYVYSAFSLYFAKTFFPKGDLTLQLLDAALIFAVGFLMRPIGGWVMGMYADRYGRKSGLLLSVLLMCFGSFMIAAAPTYQQIGYFSPCILVIARLIQGFSVGGEYGASATYLSEMSTSRYRGFYSSFQYVTLILGQLSALGVLLILQLFVLTESQLETWGWRIPFAIGGLFALVAFYLRKKIKETEIFAATKKNAPKKNLIVELLKHPRQVLTVVGLTMGGTLAFYTYSTYMQKFLVNTVGFSKSQSTLMLSVALFLFMLLQPVVGLLSDYIGRRRVLMSFGILGSISTFPILTLLSHTQNAWIAFGLILFALIIVSGYTAINAVVKAELFPVEVRVLGVGLPYALTVSLFGGTAEYIALWFKKIGHEPWFYIYVSICIGISFLVYCTMTDTKKTSLIDQEQAKTS